MTTLPVLGQLTLNGVAVAAGASILAADIDAGQFVYIPPANGAAGLTSFLFQVQDNGDTLNGGRDLDPVAKKLTIKLT